MQKAKQAVTSFEQLDFEAFSAREICHIKRIFTKSKLFSLNLFRTQVYRFLIEYQTPSCAKTQKSRFNPINTLFGVSPESLRNYYNKGELDFQQNLIDETRNAGRPTFLTSEQENEVISFLIRSHEDKKSFSVSQLNTYIASKFQISTSSNFAHDFVKKHSNS